MKFASSCIESVQALQQTANDQRWDVFFDTSLTSEIRTRKAGDISPRTKPPFIERHLKLAFGGWDA
ncbi:hypothetical protein K443DRAFT_259618 [Laccaria amethystina LaAM-08-1]|uniref:Uncharacterized protein n=1 Tax=Laccaria amethystina LaAM-08-1 TaxID=1095629 RepID=A0A0C9XHD6_9AGAR|nr:hypothetical protein K443DRAFT_259618 [Laccaria amethystina LaAM-08-1]